MNVFSAERNGSIFNGLLFLTGMAVLVQGTLALAELPGAPASPVSAAVAAEPAVPATPCSTSEKGSPYIPVDSWMYASLTRLYSLGYLDLAYLGLRPWTRSSVLHMLEETAAQLEDAPDGATTDEAREAYDAVQQDRKSVV